MPNNYHARVEMTPKMQARHSSREAVSISPVLKADTVAQQADPGNVLGPRLFRDYPIAEPKGSDDSRHLYWVPNESLIYRCMKRLFDMTLGTILLLIAMPIVLIAAVAIRIDTPGSPFFFQTRLGKSGKPFRIFKLRGMYIDARVRFPAHYDYSKQRDLEFCFHHEEDPRVTRAGRFLRKTSIDELPNLWNVVLGDMSLVGPRPEIPEVLALYGPYRDQYLSVKPGITCLSKITGRDRLTKRETIDFDLEYIRTRSFRSDLVILWRTIRSVLLRRDVF
jgi:lipopolysaccharide/colanic/teichoic acid biosynthesis glycosyltransferase